jgi:hypothetical protein
VNLPLSLNRIEPTILNVRGGGYQWSGILVPVPYHGIIPFYVSMIALSHASFALL